MPVVPHLHRGCGGERRGGRGGRAGAAHLPLPQRDRLRRGRLHVRLVVQRTLRRRGTGIVSIPGGISIRTQCGIL